jgi:hypothetical protein
VLKENTKSKLRVFERKVLRRIYGPTKESDDTWWIKSNNELNRLIGNENIINYIKAQKISLVWTCTSYARQQHVKMLKKKIYGWAPALTRSLGRPKNR